MDVSEQTFDINRVLKSLFIALKKSNHVKNIELIYEMDPHIPKDLRGDAKSLLTLLTNILTYVFKYSDEKEIVLSLSAPEDFLYEEFIAFKINKTHIGREKILAFLETELGKELNMLDGKVIYDDSDIHISIPFVISELGFRRHYRLPNKSMLEKKVLLIIESEKLSLSIAKMFKYFLYDVDTRPDVNNISINDVSRYDLVVISDRLVTKNLSAMALKVQEKKNLKCVLLENMHNARQEKLYALSTHLTKPVTQENIFELIVSLFEYSELSETQQTGSIKRIGDEEETNPTRTQVASTETKHDKDSLYSVIEEKKKQTVLILDKEMGRMNTTKMSLVYSTELENFLDKFSRSDLYFRQIVNEKSVHKIKEFCIDLEKQSKIIGAQSMLNFSDIISLIFVYDKLDMLPIYPGKYHMELTKLLNEIKTYLGR